MNAALRSFLIVTISAAGAAPSVAHAQVRSSYLVVSAPGPGSESSSTRDMLALSRASVTGIPPATPAGQPGLDFATTATTSAQLDAIARAFASRSVLARAELVTQAPNGAASTKVLFSRCVVSSWQKAAAGMVGALRCATAQESSSDGKGTGGANGTSPSHGWDVKTNKAG